MSRNTRRREVRVKPRGAGDDIKGRSRARITIIRNFGIPGHCLVIPGHCLLAIPGHGVMVFLDDWLSGVDTRWLVRVGVMDP